MRRLSNFKKADLTRAMKAVQAAGRDIARVEISRDGLIVIVPRGPGGTVGPDTRGPVDDPPLCGNAVPANDLDRELAEFSAQHDQD
jgi:hypothetical protein